MEGYQALDFENIRYSDYMGAPTETATKKQVILDDEKLKRCTLLTGVAEVRIFF